MSCNGCRVLRRGCSESCLLRHCLVSIEGAEAQGHATLFLAKFFGRAGLMGFISAVEESQRGALFQSLLYEACGRTINPVYGSAGLLWCGQWNLCEAAVRAVLKGETLQKIPFSAAMPALGLNPIKKSTFNPPTGTFVPTLSINPSMLFYPAPSSSAVPYWYVNPQAGNQPLCNSMPVDMKSNIPVAGNATPQVPPQIVSFSGPVATLDASSVDAGASYRKPIKPPFLDLGIAAPSHTPVSASCDTSMGMHCGVGIKHAQLDPRTNSPVSEPPLTSTCSPSRENSGKRSNSSSSDNSCCTLVDYSASASHLGHGSWVDSRGSDVSCEKASLVVPVARRLKPNSDSTAFMSGLTPGGSLQLGNSVYSSSFFFPLD